ncbi:response regulator [Candidatus Woesearchaeota archaeon]|nr:response regulator [Candidatus Woesearchaeota archaeon]MBI2130468.1 response regulator [Candidatus Woesearchaeota archaeon]MBI2661693.1 response regulator [Candidatus Woesearchaeota archaeon]
MKKSVLIIEDEKHIAEAQSLILGEFYRVHHAPDGEKGIEMANRLKPHVVILDIMLPKMSGYEVCRKIRGNAELKGTKIVMVTAKNQQIDEEEGMGIGADDYIMKPFEADELRHVVEQVLDRQ